MLGLHPTGRRIQCVWIMNCLLLNAAEGEEIEQSLYYAGSDEDDCLRFEWGYGYTLWYVRRM